MMTSRAATSTTGSYPTTISFAISQKPVLPVHLRRRAPSRSATSTPVIRKKKSKLILLSLSPNPFPLSKLSHKGLGKISIANLGKGHSHLAAIRFLSDRSPTGLGAHSAETTACPGLSITHLSMASRTASSGCLRSIRPSGHQGEGATKVWASREADRLPRFVSKKLELNTKSPFVFLRVRNVPFTGDPSVATAWWLAWAGGRQNFGGIGAGPAD